MAAVSVEVLCPNGRRQKVKTTMSSAILHILEECCKKQGYDPNEYDLKHQRSILDITSLIRFANLSNNAKLELIKRSKPRTAAQVVIALQLESGARLQGSFSASTTLLNVLTQLEKDNTGESLLAGCPVCIYTSTEVCGTQALRTTKLQDLGLVAGRAVIRLVRREAKDDASNDLENVQFSAADHFKGGENIVTDKMDESLEKTIGNSVEACAVMECRKKEDVSLKETHNRTSKTVGHYPARDSSSELFPVKHRNAPVNTMTSSSKPTSEDKTVQSKSTKDGEAGFIELAPEGKKPKLSNPEPECGVEGPFSNFKFPERAYSEEERDVKPIDPVQLRKEVRLGMPCERHALLFPAVSADTSSLEPAAQDIPDDFYDVTVEDLRKMLRDLKSERAQVENAPLLTSTMRQADIAKRLETYDKVVLRICFPEGIIIQGFFQPLETVQVVTDFVSQYVDATRASGIYLYTTPPKVTLKDQEMTLFKAGLIPTAIVYVGSTNGSGSLLKETCLNDIASRKEAEALVRKELTGNADGKDNEMAWAQTDVAKEGASTTSASPARSSNSDNGPASPSLSNRPNQPSASTRPKDPKVPKWLRLGK